jgi:hypothetical protein
MELAALVSTAAPVLPQQQIQPSWREPPVGTQLHEAETAAAPASAALRVRLVEAEARHLLARVRRAWPGDEGPMEPLQVVKAASQA